MKFDKLFFRHDEAVALGSSDKAVILEFVRWSCHFKESDNNQDYLKRKYFMDDVWWMQDSHEAWQERLPWLGKTTIRRYLDELCDRGFLFKRVVIDERGRAPNFYRANSDAQIGPRGVVSKTDIGSVQIGQGVVSNLAPIILSTKIQTKIQTNKSASPGGDLVCVPKWLEDDPFSGIFQNLIKLPACKAKFIADEYRRWLEGLMKEFNLTMEDLKKTSNAWQEYHNESSKKIASPKGSFRTWVTNYAKGRTENVRYKSKPEVIDYSATSDKHARVNPLKPWEDLPDGQVNWVREDDEI